MGDLAISALVSEVVGKLTSEVIKELALLWGIKDDISTLKNDFDQIEAVLQDAEEKHIKEKAVELWVKRLRSASIVVENLLDDISTEALLQRLHKEKGIKYRVRAFFSSNHNPFMFRIRIAHKVNAIRRKLDDIASKRYELKLTPSCDTSDVDVRFERHMLDRETSSFIHDSSVIFGRNKEVEMITEKICNRDIQKYDDGEIQVYGIWGMGGVGKTTLAQLVYNHERVNKSFEFKCWVHVSENFQVKEVLRKIIETIDKCRCTLTLLESLQESLQSKLRGKKCLIVLDDVWIEDNEKAKWDQLSETLGCAAIGSTVVITTRSKKTSRMTVMIPELQHNLGCLSHEDSWLLFKKFAFAKGREGDEINELEPIGREIVQKCKGLPLAVKTLGSLMWSKSSISDWQCMKSSFIWELQDNVLSALKLSYVNLLPHLKRCFAYCCLFPKGFEMEKDDVIQLWVVNGFIPPRGEIDLYVLGEEIFNCLVWRSFFQVVDAHEDRFNMHDLMHDMARHMMGDDCLVIEHGKEVRIPNEALHLSSSCPDFLFLPQDLGKLTSLRSIFMFGKDYQCSISQNFNHEYLRVLYLCGIGLRTIPESICKLKHLKYLNLSKSYIRVLPESIMYLQNLQVLVLSSCDNLYELPASFCKLKHLRCLNLSKSGIVVLPESIIYLQNLRVLILSLCQNLCKLPEGLRCMRKLQHLDIYNCYSLRHLPKGIKELTSLRILPRFLVSKESGAKIGELGDLDLIEGELEIWGLDNVRGLSEAQSANLNCKRNMLILGLTWLRKRDEMFAYDEEVLEGLEPNSYLKGLKLYGYMGKVISPSWIVNLRNLVEIQFYNCENCEHIPTLGRLPNLRVIKMKFMLSLRYLHDEAETMLGDTTNSFHCLQELDIYQCPNLVSLPSNLPELKVLELQMCSWRLVSLPISLPKLEVLKIYSCDKLVSLPISLPKLEVLKIYSCDKLVSLPISLPKLEVLKIYSCEKLVSLPGNLPNIRKLYLGRCDNLLSLPKEIQGFKNLNELVILGCQHLFERYEKEKGVDWPKISHVPVIKMEERSIGDNIRLMMKEMKMMMNDG